MISSYQPYLEHSDDDVRIEAFRTLVTSKKTLVPISIEEAKSIKLFYQDNISIDSAAFRQRLVSSFYLCENDVFTNVLFYSDTMHDCCFNSY